MKSKFLKLNKRDIINAVVVGAGVLGVGQVAAPAVTDLVNPEIVDTITQAEPSTHQGMVYTIIAVAVYVLKNFFTNSKGQLFKKED